MIKITVLGSKGRMGKRICDNINSDPEVELQGIIDIDTDEKKIKKYVEACDVVIDFSAPFATLKNLPIILEAKKPMVIGTTGFSGEEKKMINKASKVIPCVLSPNMSIGVNVFFELLKKTASLLKEYDTEIIELHHNQKEDAPSGTALKLADIIAEATGKNKDNWVYGRKGNIGVRPDNEIGIHALRVGDVVGEHTVMFAGNNERIEITHKAHTRNNFAKGSVIAAKWILKQSQGLYDMKDVLGI